MALSRGKKSEQEQEEIKDHDIKVEHVRDTKYGVFFDLCINGVAIYGCSWIEGQKKDGTEYRFISFPSHKGKDDKYYNHAYVKLSDNDIDSIEKTLQDSIDSRS